jgi:serine/threonine protein kinase
MSVYHKGVKITEQYKLEDELGRGSFAIVMAATNKNTGQKVAVKVFEM